MQTQTVASVPTTVPDLNSETGLKNLAGWIARYNNFGLNFDEISHHIRELLENGTLSKFESSLVGLRCNCSYEENGPDEFERYEFSFMIENFVHFENHQDDHWASLHFYFKSNYCLMCVTSCGEGDMIEIALKTMFTSIDVEPLYEDEQRDVSWQEADRIICAYLQYINNPIIQVPPKES